MPNIQNIQLPPPCKCGAISRWLVQWPNRNPEYMCEECFIKLNNSCQDVEDRKSNLDAEGHPCTGKKLERPTAEPCYFPGGPISCPFCEKYPSIEPRTHWTGMRSIIIDVRLICRGDNHYIEMRGKTEEEVIKRWNNRP